MEDKSILKKVKIMILIGVLMFIWAIVRMIIFFNQPTAQFTQEFEDQYGPLNLASYYDEEGKLINEDGLKTSINENYVFNVMLNEYTDVNNNQLPVKEAAIFLNVLRCAYGSSLLQDVTQEEINMYSTDGYVVKAKILKKNFDLLAKDLMDIDTTNIVVDDTLKNYCAYDTKNKTYYLLEDADKKDTGNDASFEMRCLNKIEKNEDVYTIYMDKYETYTEIMKDIRNFIELAKTKTYKEIYNEILKKYSINEWEREVIKIKENPDGFYTKYTILSKTENKYVVGDIQNNTYLLLNIEDKISNLQYNVSLADCYFEVIEDGKLTGKVLKPGERMVLYSQLDYDMEMKQHIAQDMQVAISFKDGKAILKQDEDQWLIDAARARKMNMQNSQNATN